MNYDFCGKRALVTGAGKGMGREIAIALSNCNAVVFGLDFDQEGLNSLNKEHPSITTHKIDLRNWKAVQELVHSLAPIQLLANNAGVAVIEPFLDMKPESFDFTMACNVRQIICISQTVARDLIARKLPGAIVSTSSTASRFGMLDHVAYNASKGAVDQLTKVMALELGPHNVCQRLLSFTGIRVNAVNPTVVLTDMGRRAWDDPAKSGPIMRRIPLGRFAEVDDVVQAYLYLLSDQSSMIHGTMLGVDGGFFTF